MTPAHSAGRTMCQQEESWTMIGWPLSTRKTESCDWLSSQLGGYKSLDCQLRSCNV